jgi:hypothetical protein
LVLIVVLKGFMTWYVVYRGKQPGVYDSWARCNEQVAGHKKNSYKSFPSKEEVVASYLEYMGCEDVLMDDKPVVKPCSIARGNQSCPKFPALVAVAVFQSFLVMLLVLFIGTRCCRCI